jgi:hypothetical protein
MTPEAPTLTDAQVSAQVIQSQATHEGVQAIIIAASGELTAKHANTADLIVACSMMLADVITRGTRSLSVPKRQGIMALIDSYAMICAIGDEP